MAKKFSAGILLYRKRDGRLEVFLVHPGGPFWEKKDRGAWSIPKGLYHEGEDPMAAAQREFAEETGSHVTGLFHPLDPLLQPSGKLVSVWAVEGDLDPATLTCNTFPLEWPPHSGTIRDFPEVDRGAWFDIPTAHERIQPGQRGFLDQLQTLLKRRGE
ncbi:NUDIX domain-containing protein [Petrachloros mirabilis]